MNKNKMDKDFNIDDILKDYVQPNLNIKYEKNSNSDIGAISYHEIDFTAQKKDEYSIPSTACFTDVRYTPASFPVNGVTNLLSAEIGIYVNKCLDAGKKVDIAEFIARFNARYHAVVKIVSIQAIDVYKRRIKELEKSTTTNIKRDRRPDNKQAIELEL